MKTNKDTYLHPTDYRSARLNYPNLTMQPFVLQNSSVGFQYPKPALSYSKLLKIMVPWAFRFIKFDKRNTYIDYGLYSYNFRLIKYGIQVLKSPYL